MTVKTQHITAEAQSWAWAEIDLAALSANYAELKKLAAKNMAHNAGLMPVIKADAYGHGMIETAKCLDAQGCLWFAVSNVLEGITLRQQGFKQQILLFESTLPQDSANIIEHQLTPTVCTLDLAQALDAQAAAAGVQVPVHIKVDTGMGRLGVDEDDILAFVEKLRTDCPRLVLEGIYTHFPLAVILIIFTRLSPSRAERPISPSRSILSNTRVILDAVTMSRLPMSIWLMPLSSP